MKIRAFITKSPEVAMMIEKSLISEMNEIASNLDFEYEIHVSRKILFEDTSVPAIYHNKGYWLSCLVEHCPEESYSLTIA